MLCCGAAPLVRCSDPSPASDSGSNRGHVGYQNLGAIGKHNLGLVWSDLLNDHCRVGLVDSQSITWENQIDPATLCHLENCPLLGAYGSGGTVDYGNNQQRQQ